MFTVLNAQSVFNIYPDVDPTMLSTSLGFSETCLVAMYVYLSALVDRLNVSFESTLTFSCIGTIL